MLRIRCVECSIIAIVWFLPAGRLATVGVSILARLPDPRYRPGTVGPTPAGNIVRGSFAVRMLTEPRPSFQPDASVTAKGVGCPCDALGSAMMKNSSSNPVIALLFEIQSAPAGTGSSNDPMA